MLTNIYTQIARSAKEVYTQDGKAFYYTTLFAKVVSNKLWVKLVLNCDKGYSFYKFNTKATISITVNGVEKTICSASRVPSAAWKTSTVLCEGSTDLPEQATVGLKGEYIFYSVGEGYTPCPDDKLTATCSEVKLREDIRPTVKMVLNPESNIYQNYTPITFNFTGSTDAARYRIRFGEDGIVYDTNKVRTFSATCPLAKEVTVYGWAVGEDGIVSDAATQTIKVRPYEIPDFDTIVCQRAYRDSNNALVYSQLGELVYVQITPSVSSNYDEEYKYENSCAEIQYRYKKASAEWKDVWTPLTDDAGEYKDVIAGPYELEDGTWGFSNSETYFLQFRIKDKVGAFSQIVQVIIKSAEKVINIPDRLKGKTIGFLMPVPENAKEGEIYFGGKPIFKGRAEIQGGISYTTLMSGNLSAGSNVVVNENIQNFSFLKVETEASYYTLYSKKGSGDENPINFFALPNGTDIILQVITGDDGNYYLSYSSSSTAGQDITRIYGII